MAEVGADAAIVVTPNYYKAGMTAASLEHHYNLIADACPIPVILYNVPVFTGLDMPAESVINLSQHPNIIGIKESSSNIGKVGLMVHGAPKDFQVLTGSASGLLGSLSVGAVGGVMALANIAAPQIARLIQYFEQGNLSEALAIQLQLIPANIAVTAHLGIPGLKAALDMLGYYGGPARSPLMPLPEADKANLRVILSEAGIL
jgi:4-hydroxy-2-oxoglutarate aldolase